MANVQIEESWRFVLEDEFEKAYFKHIVQFLKNEKAAQKIIFPAGPHIFNAFAQTPFDKVKVVILGQDPYHQPNQAHGLSFSVLPPTPPPPSLQNIFKELNEDVGIPTPTNGDLTNWAQQGVLLLNASLTVEHSKPMSHSKIGWAFFTDAVIKKISENKSNIVFILWGKFAQSKKVLIDATKHCIIESAHPSPLSAFSGFFGSKPFSKTNQYLKEKNIQTIEWSID